jgi:hypothetical protein
MKTAEAGITSPECNRTPDADSLAFLSEKRCRVGDSIVEIAYRPTFGDWLLWLESDERLLMKEAGSPRNTAWVKSLLLRWRDAGRPCPEEWPETRNLDWLRPARSAWPEING